jgi:malate permease and related proteins
MEILNTIIPIFVIIFIGWFARYMHFIPQNFLAPANRIVFYLAIPAMIFKAVSGASFSHSFDFTVLAVAMLSATLGYLFAYISGTILKLKKGSLGSFIQSSSHCNIGYIAFAVAYYYLGNEGLAKTGLFAGLIMIQQNFYSVIVLAIWSDRKTDEKSVRANIVTQVMLNPIIISAGFGIVFSVAEISLPLFISRSLDILGGMGLPTALLIIGASLSLGQIRIKFPVVIISTVIKLIFLPAIAMGLFMVWDVPAAQRLPILIILAAPTATVTYVMAGEMGGDTDLAAAGISLCTILSLFSYLFWLHVA